MAQKRSDYLGYSCRKTCSQDLSKVTWPGHTALKGVTFPPKSFQTLFEAFQSIQVTLVASLPSFKYDFQPFRTPFAANFRRFSKNIFSEVITDTYFDHFVWWNLATLAKFFIFFGKLPSFAFGQILNIDAHVLNK